MSPTAMPSEVKGKKCNKYHILLTLFFNGSCIKLWILVFADVWPAWTCLGHKVKRKNLSLKLTVWTLDSVSKRY